MFCSNYPKFNFSDEGVLIVRSESEDILIKCKEISNRKICEIREAACNCFSKCDNLLVGINGSYARREATVNSDIDLFIIATDGDVCNAKIYQEKFSQILKKSDFILPAKGGVFEHPLGVEEIMKIGGINDDNTNITRRTLLLLEGEWIFNEKGFYKLRRKILKKYIPKDLACDKIYMFLFLLTYIASRNLLIKGRFLCCNCRRLEFTPLFYFVRWGAFVSAGACCILYNTTGGVAYSNT